MLNKIDKLYDFDPSLTREEITEMESKFSSEINDLILKIDYEWFPHKKHTVKFGASAVLHSFNTKISNFIHYQNININAIEKIPALEFYFYISDNYKITDKFTANIGVHTSMYSVINNETFYSTQPRIGLNYTFNNKTALKASL